MLISLHSSTVEPFAKVVSYHSRYDGDYKIFYHDQNLLSVVKHLGGAT
jgi:hypothetical protein